LPARRTSAAPQRNWRREASLRRIADYLRVMTVEPPHAARTHIFQFCMRGTVATLVIASRFSAGDGRRVIRDSVGNKCQFRPPWRVSDLAPAHLL
jgi:hypothetical protein